jgi:hypothetical protein
MNRDVAMCPRCDDTPLVMTFLWPRREFYCLDCGGTFEFLSPRAAYATDERLAKMETVRTEFRLLADGAYPEYAWLEDCTLCSSHEEYHAMHATPEQQQARLDAFQRLAHRVKVRVT